MHEAHLLRVSQAEHSVQMKTAAKCGALAHNQAASTAAAHCVMPQVHGDMHTCSAQSGMADRPRSRAPARRMRGP